jgi:ribosomal protein S18 acetylase RimI-like enzyme
VPVSIRTATLEDFDSIDQLQSKTTKQVGWMPKQQIEGKIRAGNVLVAWASRPCGMGGTPMLRVGYVIGQDRYFKRDDVGIIYALNVVEEHRRSLIGAALLQAMFERSAYGCRLFCCWCAQDIAANRFWEAMGFVSLAFRSGGRHRGTKARRHEGEDSPFDLPSVPSCLRASVPAARIHIFWQKRIRPGDDATPWWFPAQTSGGIDSGRSAGVSDPAGDALE